MYLIPAEALTRLRAELYQESIRRPPPGWLTADQLIQKYGHLSVDDQIRLSETLTTWRLSGAIQPVRIRRTSPPYRRTFYYDPAQIEALLAAGPTHPTTSSEEADQGAPAGPQAGASAAPAPMAGAQAPGLNDTEQAIVAWVKAHGPAIAKEIAKGTDLQCNSYLRGILGKLLKSGALCKARGGYIA
jgi:hypothetical protein